MTARFESRLAAALLVAGLPLGSVALAASPTAEQALKLTPVQRNVEYDRPTDGSKCTIKAEKIHGKTGWVVRDPAGQVLRNFVDTNGDNVVDQWCYFQAGIEVYRDVDGNFNGKADEARWLNTAGTRWGLDQNEDGRIDTWKAISAEELSAEFVAAVRDRDSARYLRLLPTSKEIQSLGLGAEREAELSKKLSNAATEFMSAAARQKLVDTETKWVSFGASRPGTWPAGTAGSTSDITVYENSSAVVDSKGKDTQLNVGTLARVNDAWRLLDIVDGDIGRDFTMNRSTPSPANTGGQLPEVIQKLMKELETIDQDSIKATTPELQATLNTRRADVLESLIKEADTANDRAQWQKQYADTVSAAVQAGAFPNGVERLKKLYQSISSETVESELIPYVQFRLMTAEYTANLQKPDAKYEEIQAKWLEDLEKFVASYPSSPDAADAYLQLAIALEFSGQEEKALKHYDIVTKNFASNQGAKKALGAKTRLESVGKSITLRGKTLGGTTFDLASLKGKVVLLQYWAAWAEPCRTDLPQLKEMQDKYGAKGFAIVGISLDNTRQELEACLTENRIKWPQVFEEGGLDGRLANEMGILTVPTMILIDKQGRVLNRSIHAAELDRELRNIFK